MKTCFAKIRTLFIVFALGAYIGGNLTRIYYKDKLNQMEDDYEAQMEDLRSMYNNFRNDNETYRMFHSSQVYKNTLTSQRLDAKTQRIRELALQVASLQEYLHGLHNSCK